MPKVFIKTHEGRFADVYASPGSEVFVFEATTAYDPQPFTAQALQKLGETEQPSACAELAREFRARELTYRRRAESEESWVDREHAELKADTWAAAAAELERT